MTAGKPRPELHPDAKSELPIVDVLRYRAILARLPIIKALRPMKRQRQ